MTDKATRGGPMELVGDRRVDFNYQMAVGCNDATSNSLRIVRGK